MWRYIPNRARFQASIVATESCDRSVVPGSVEVSCRTVCQWLYLTLHCYLMPTPRHSGSHYVLAAIAETITSKAAICPHVVKAMGGPCQFAEYEVPFAARSKRALYYGATNVRVNITRVISVPPEHQHSYESKLQNRNYPRFSRTLHTDHVWRWLEEASISTILGHLYNYPSHTFEPDTIVVARGTWAFGDNPITSFPS